MTDAAKWREDYARWRNRLRAEAKPAFWDSDADNQVPEAFVQWKNTSLCMDFTCVCGLDGHVDDYFCYVVECAHCGRKYEVGDWISVRLMDTDDEKDFNPVIVTDEGDRGEPGMLAKPIRDDMTAYAKGLLTSFTQKGIVLSPGAQAAWALVAAGESRRASQDHYHQAFARAAHGASLLDGRTPRWWSPVQLDRLDMWSETDSILGQIYGDRAAGLRELRIGSTGLAGWLGYGSDELDDLRDFDLAALEVAWRSPVRARKEYGERPA
jgi:hypothetical protein